MSIVTPISDVSVANMAIHVLDDVAITTFNDDTPVSRHLTREYSVTRDEVLASYPWHFAQRRALLTPLSSIPMFGWRYQYQLPTDCLTLHPLRERGDPNGRLIDYEVEDGKVLTDATGPLPVSYTKRETNAAKFTPGFARTLATRLAVLAATAVTGKISYLSKAVELHRSAEWDAHRVDALSRRSAQYVQMPNETQSTYLAVRGNSLR